MKVSQSDLLHLFAPPSEPGEATASEANQIPAPEVPGPENVPVAVPAESEPLIAPVPASSGRSQPPVATGSDGSFTTLHREVAAALPALWAKAKKQNLSRAEERKKLRALLAWLASKKGLQTQEAAPMRYRHETQTVDGKIDLLVKGDEGKAVLAVEADWTLQEASVAKLKAAHDRGIPVMWILGTPAKTRLDAKEARKFASRLLGREVGGWLVIFHLEHGWL